MMIFLTVFMFINIILCITNAILFNQYKKDFSLAFCISSGFLAQFFMFLLILKSVGELT